MHKRTIIWLVIAAALVLIGGMLFGGVMSMLKWDFTKLSTMNYETNTYEPGEAFEDITLKTDTAGIVFALSDDVKCRVVCHEEVNAKHSVTIQDSALVIELLSNRSIIDYIGINADVPKITVYLPATEYASLLISGSTGDIEIPKDFHFGKVDISLSTGRVTFNASVLEHIRIRATTGDIRMENVSAGALELSVSTGKVTATNVQCEGDVSVAVTTGKAVLSDITCQNLISGGDTGDVSLKNVIAEETFSITRSTGDVRFDRCDAAEIFVTTDTGSVSGSLLTSKVFITQTDTGRVDVPNSATGGRCEITTDTGNIKITIG